MAVAVSVAASSSGRRAPWLAVAEYAVVVADVVVYVAIVMTPAGATRLVRHIHPNSKRRNGRHHKLWPRPSAASTRLVALDPKPEA